MQETYIYYREYVKNQLKLCKKPIYIIGMKNKRNIPLSLQLYSIANAQSGYFTVKQAKEIGYKDANFGFYIKRGYWEHCARGVYRITCYPVEEFDDHALWSLWAQNRNASMPGVISHLSALRFYDICDVSPSKIHMTVPPNFRSSSIPGILILHKGFVDINECEQMAGFNVTNIKQTLLDVGRAYMIDGDHLAQALSNALASRLIDEQFVLTHKEFEYILPCVHFPKRGYSHDSK